MELQRITNSQDPLLAPLIPLFEESFPAEERRPVDQLKELIDDKKEMHFNAIFHEGQLCGLFTYWDLDEFYYVEYLAVFPTMRNHKIGAKVLDYMASHLKGIRLLEVEPAGEEFSTRRIEYYRRHGYEVVDKEYVQLSYDKDAPSCELWIMGNEVPDLLQEYIETIKSEVYRIYHT